MQLLGPPPSVMSVPCRSSSPCFALATAIALLAAPLPVLAASPRLGHEVSGRALFAPAAEGKTSVLGFEGSDASATSAVTQALRDTFAARGMSGGDEVTLHELRLTMGCNGNDPNCLAEGGTALGVDKLVYGRVGAAPGGGYSIDVYVLDVATRRVERETTREFAASELSGSELKATAARLVAALYGEDELTAATDAGGSPVVEPTPSAKPEPPPPSDRSRIVWGRQHPTPTWKYAALGVSAGLTVVALGTAIGASVMIRDGGPLYDDLIQAARESLADDKPSNDIDPNSSEDLCVLARREPPGEPGTVTNASVTRVCNKADALETTANVSWGLTGAFAAATVVFTILLFVHKEKPGAAAARRHDLHLGLAPRPGGFALSGGLRF